MADRKVLSGAPTKRFFVSMLPRDIELTDAILDLVDNSVDGAMRQERENLRNDHPFEGYRCDLQLENDRFTLNDNCGGIPSKHLDAAFRLGRPDLEIDSDLPTIGMYGIGMKRAIFKMARDAVVESRAVDSCVKVHYDERWLNPESDDWDLELSSLEDTGEYGVSIYIEQLQESVSKKFQSERFLDDLKEALGQHFAYIMEKGFRITVNGETVSPETVRVILKDSVAPYDYEATYGTVDIKVLVGFYRNLTRQFELEESTDPEHVDSRRQFVGEAGITVICNDRVVLISDKTTVTGWGLGNVPRYHPQFRSITGIIIFTSEDASQLPISTTKRDLDTDSDLYNRARNAAMEGLKVFIAFTNQWKGAEKETDHYLASEFAVEADSISLARSKDGSTVRGSDGAARKFVPNLPLPPKGEKRRRVSFSRDAKEVEQLGEVLLGNPKEKPSLIGIAAWEDVLSRVSEDER